MSIFVQQIKHSNTKNSRRTLDKLRTINEIRQEKSVPEDEKVLYEPGGELERAFPLGAFNCWGVTRDTWFEQL